MIVYLSLCACCKIVLWPSSPPQQHSVILMPRPHVPLQDPVLSDGTFISNTRQERESPLWSTWPRQKIENGLRRWRHWGRMLLSLGQGHRWAESRSPSTHSQWAGGAAALCRPREKRRHEATQVMSHGVRFAFVPIDDVRRLRHFIRLMTGFLINSSN